MHVAFSYLYCDFWRPRSSWRRSIWCYMEAEEQLPKGKIECSGNFDIAFKGAIRYDPVLAR